MTKLQTASLPLWSRGLVAVLAAQFITAMADNALLFGALALLKSEHYPGWAAPILQEFFVCAYIFLAPFVGPFADCMPKGRVMLAANLVKLLGAVAMCLGVNPFVAYGVIGIGAATYSPAKYGILSELTSADQLVRANSLMEASTIAAILIGALSGGVLADWSVRGTLIIVASCFALAALASLLIPKLVAERPLGKLSIAAMLREFFHGARGLFGASGAQFALVGTSLFWGSGATMRFLLVAWVPVALGIHNNRMPAFLNAMVAIGIVIGAGLAAKFVTVEKADRALPAGVLIGLAVCLLSTVSSLPLAFVIMAVVGCCGGFFVVPLNALIQEKGHESVGAGHAIAVQNLGENITMLLMIGAYTLAFRAGMPITTLACSFGALLALLIGAVCLHRARFVRLAALEMN